jgi:hypothetical protein
MPASPEMSSTQYYTQHNRLIAWQRSSIGGLLGALISGHKKDLVLTGRLVLSASRVAIYGWHRASGIPIQPLSSVHGATYADYSHGVRLVSETMLIDGEPRSIYDVLADPQLCRLLSDEGPLTRTWQILQAHSPQNFAPAEIPR